MYIVRNKETKNLFIIKEVKYVVEMVGISRYLFNKWDKKGQLETLTHIVEVPKRVFLKSKRGGGIKDNLENKFGSAF